MHCVGACRANAQQPKLFVGMILILIFAEALALYGLIGARPLALQLFLGTRAMHAMLLVAGSEARSQAETADLLCTCSGYHPGVQGRHSCARDCRTLKGYQEMPADSQALGKACNCNSSKCCSSSSGESSLDETSSWEGMPAR